MAPITKKTTSVKNVETEPSTLHDIPIGRTTSQEALTVTQATKQEKHARIKSNLLAKKKVPVTNQNANETKNDESSHAQ